MERQEIKNKIIGFLRDRSAMEATPGRVRDFGNIQMGDILRLFSERSSETATIAREVVQELINADVLFPGMADDPNSSYPWLTITAYGREALPAETWLPYDPDGYLEALKREVPQLDPIALSYVAEAVAAFNRRHLLSATITLGVASEQLFLNLLDAYLQKLDPTRRARLEKRTEGRGIYAQYREFKAAFTNDVEMLPAELRPDWETYLDGIFNFIRINRNSAGHPTGKALSAKVVYANLQIFADYARYMQSVIRALT